MHSNRMLPLSGIAFVALCALSLLVGGGTPSSGASAEEIAMLVAAIWIVATSVTITRGVGRRVSSSADHGRADRLAYYTRETS